MPTQRWAACIAAAASIGWTIPAGAQEADATDSGSAEVIAGKEYYGDVCSNCHGPTAKGMASFPKLTGHEAEFLTMRLEQYRAGEKVGPNTALMAPIAADLSDADIANLVAFILTELN